MRVEIRYNNDFCFKYIQDMNFESKEETKNYTYYYFSDLETARKEMKKQVNRMVEDLDFSVSFQYSRDFFRIDGINVLEITF